MVRLLFSLVVFTGAVVGSAPALAQGVMRSALHDFRVVTVADGLVQPWSIAFLPGGDMLITERPGRLRIVRSGRLLPQAVEGLPPVVYNDQASVAENRCLSSRQICTSPPRIVCGAEASIVATPALSQSGCARQSASTNAKMLPAASRTPRLRAGPGPGCGS